MHCNRTCLIDFYFNYLKTQDNVNVSICLSFLIHFFLTKTAFAKWHLIKIISLLARLLIAKCVDYIWVN